MAEDEELQVLGGVAVGEQRERLDGAVQRELGEFRQHLGGLREVSGGVTLPRHD